MAPPGRGNTALSDIELEEALAKKSLERGMFMRLLPLLYPVRGWVIGAVLIEALLVGAIFLRPWLVSEVIDEGFIPSDSCIVAGTMLWLISPLLFFSVAAVVPILVVATVIFKKISQRNWGIVAENRSRFTAHLVETVAGARTIKQNNFEAPNQLRYRQLVRNFNQSLVRGNIRSSWFAPLTTVLTTSAMAILLVVGGRGVALEQITLGQVAASLFYVFIFLAPLQELSDLFERYANGAACAVTSVWCCRIMCCSAVPSSTTCALLRRMPAMNS